MARCCTSFDPSAAKSALYGCAVHAVGTARERFPTNFYLVCMLFILLDVGAAFLGPWALVVREPGFGMFARAEMFVFITLLGGGFVYAWKTGALDW